MSGHGQRIAILLSGMLLILIANATYLNIEGPVTGNLMNNGSIYLGKVGPGESFYISASATTANASGTLINIGWNRLEAVTTPPGWSSQQSPLYQDPMKMKVTIPADTQIGNYKMAIRAVNVQNYSKLGNITVYAYVNVTPNVFVVNVTPMNIQTGIGQPTNLYVTINNTGISDDPFIINASGLPAWNDTSAVISLHSTKNTFTYPVYVNEPAAYTFNITVSASSSPQIQRKFEIHLLAGASLLNDYSAINQGALLSPVVFAPPYAIMSLISYLYKLYTGM